MAFDKPFLDIDKQLDLLESRNLIIRLIGQKVCVKTLITLVNI